MSLRNAGPPANEQTQAHSPRGIARALPRPPAAGQSIRTFNPQVLRGAAYTGIDVGAIVGAGRDARLILAEVKDVTGVVPRRSLSALGLGRSGRRTLDRNLLGVRRALGRVRMDPATRRAINQQLEDSSFDVYLIGSRAKGTVFTNADAQQIRRAANYGGGSVRRYNLEGF